MKNIIRLMLIAGSACMLLANIQNDSIIGVSASLLFLVANSLAFSYNLIHHK